MAVGRLRTAFDFENKIFINILASLNFLKKKSGVVRR